MRAVRAWKAARPRSVQLPPFGPSTRPRAPRSRNRSAHALRGRHHVQQLLRVRLGQGRPGAARRTRCARGRGRSRSTARSSGRARSTSTRCCELVPARGARLPHALRRGLVDGDPVARLPAARVRAQRSSPPRAPSTSRSRRCSTPSRCRTSTRRRSDVAVRRGPAHRRGHAPARAARGRASTARRCPTRTARRCGWWCRGSTASRASSRS